MASTSAIVGGDTFGWPLRSCAGQQARVARDQIVCRREDRLEQAVGLGDGGATDADCRSLGSPGPHRQGSDLDERAVAEGWSQMIREQAGVELASKRPARAAAPRSPRTRRREPGPQPGRSRRHVPGRCVARRDSQSPRLWWRRSGAPPTACRRRRGSALASGRSRPRPGCVTRSSGTGEPSLCTSGRAGSALTP